MTNLGYFSFAGYDGTTQFSLGDGYYESLPWRRSRSLPRTQPRRYSPSGGISFAGAVPLA